jgi:hypothetical protein
MSNAHKAAIASIAEAQHGMFSIDDAREQHVSKHEIRRRVADGTWIRRYDGAYMIAGTPVTWRGELLAACLAGGKRAVASHRSAAALHDLPGARTDITEITCPRWRRATEEGLVVHESKALEPELCTRVDNIPVAGVELTLLMLGAVCSALTVEMALDAALRRELVTYGSTRDVLKSVGRRGRNGAGVLRAILDERVPERAIAESPMETKLLRLLRDLGFPTPVPQYEVWIHGCYCGRLDAAYPEQRVGLEYQSYEHHAGKLAIDHDNARRRRFRAIEWDIIEVTPADVRDRGLHLAPTLWRALGVPVVLAL